MNEKEAPAGADTTTTVPSSLRSMSESIEDSPAIARTGSKEAPENENEKNGEGVESKTPFKLSARGFIILAVYMLLTLLVAVDSTAIGAPLPVITAELHGTTTQAIWTGSSYLLSSAVFLPTIGSLSEIFGRMPLTELSTLLFAVGSIICAVAHSFTVLIIGRTIQGVGGGGILVLTEIIVTDLVPLRERGKYFGYIGAVWALGTIVAPIFSSGVTQSSTWRWIFYFNLPICGIALVLIPILVRMHLDSSTILQKIKRIDIIGISVFTASMTSLLLGITFGGVNFPWNSYHVLLPLILGVVGFAGFCVYEYKVPKDPMIRLAVFSNRSAFIGYIQVLIHGLILWCLIYYLPLYYQGVKGYSALISGVAALPETITISPMAIISGILVAKYSHYVYQSWVAWAFVTLGAGLLYLLKVHTTVGQFIGLNIPISIGAGILFASLNISVIAPNTNENTPYAAAMLAFVRVMGQAIGVAIGGSIFANRLSDKISSDPLLSAFRDNSQAIALVEVIKHLPESPVKAALILAFDDAVRLVYIILAAFAGFAFILNIFVKEYSLDVDYKSKQHVVENNSDAVKNDVSQAV
ncbi:Vba5p [Sugiyamaella lignohabitans]|uniref:Vba5p n=1 Tax=Sugiyamaella lignohabitans TaxID=796027 RepID=A0A167DEX8_9ASCO|nr:Vba5p [Sugiyamaella lignohabitans]ANB12839.1 Vba5p [Sugiyamaella lignohabitans]